MLQPEEAAAPKVTQQPLPQLYHGQLYNAVLKLALSPLHPDAAVSCSVSLCRPHTSYSGHAGAKLFIE
jgi:hypothetical protein